MFHGFGRFFSLRPSRGSRGRARARVLSGGKSVLVRTARPSKQRTTLRAKIAAGHGCAHGDARNTPAVHQVQCTMACLVCAVNDRSSDPCAWSPAQAWLTLFAIKQLLKLSHIVAHPMETSAM